MSTRIHLHAPLNPILRRHPFGVSLICFLRSSSISSGLWRGSKLRNNTLPRGSYAAHIFSHTRDRKSSLHGQSRSFPVRQCCFSTRKSRHFLSSLLHDPAENSFIHFSQAPSSGRPSRDSSFATNLRVSWHRLKSNETMVYHCRLWVPDTNRLGTWKSSTNQ